MIRILGFLAVALIALAGTDARASCRPATGLGAPRNAVPAKTNEYRRAGAGLYCVLEENAAKAVGGDSLPPAHRMCHLIGNVGVDMARADVEATLGKPHRTVPRGKDDAAVYWLPTPNQPVGYYVVYYVGNIVDAVQATLASADAPSLTVAFSSIRPGDAAQQALDVLGLPKEVCTGEGIMGEMWDYRPHEITLEVVRGRVFSIKVSNPH